MKDANNIKKNLFRYVQNKKIKVNEKISKPYAQ